MRARLLVSVVAFAAGSLGAGCPKIDEAPPRSADVTIPSPAPASSPPAPAPLKTVSAAAPQAPASAPAAPLVDPGELATLPPELVDDGTDDAPDPEPAPPPGPRPAAADELASTAKETWIFAEPHWKARRLGYLRAGAIVERRSEPTTKNGSCPEGWYRIEPRGYVCVGATATLNVSEAVVEASARRPRRDGLPYAYVMSRFPPPPFYARLPSEEEALRAEPDLRGQLRKAARFALDPAYVPPPAADPVPGSLLYGRPAPTLAGVHHAADAVEIGHARARSGFALLSTFDYEGRRYGLTTELAVLPIDRTRVIKPSTFSGRTLDDEVSLPVAFVRSHHANRFVSLNGALTRGDALGFREAVPITGKEQRMGGVTYLEAKDGSLIREDQSVRVDKFHHAPAWATGHRKWIDVSILEQALVAYEGNKPVYVTLVSTGADGLGDPKKTHSTIQGAFLIHTKHLSVTMDDDKIGDEFDFRDVPFVQYFTEGFALHAAYWHDEFGTPRSHGCVNLAPLDAAWLFNWTDPEVPTAWHAALSVKKGTLVYVHP